MFIVIGPAATRVSAGVEYDFFLVESFDPNYALAETLVNDINESAVAVGSDTFGGLIWDETAGKTQLPYSGPTTLNNADLVVYNNAILDPVTGDLTIIPEYSSGYPIIALRHLNDNMVGVGYARHTGTGCEPFNCPYDCAQNLLWDPIQGSRQVANVPDLKAFLRVNNSNIAIGQIVHLCDDQQGVVYDLNTGDWINLSSSLPPLTIGYDAQTKPTDISDAGHVVGTALWGSDPQHGFIWNEVGGFTFLPPLALGEVDYVFPKGVNVGGQVVGSAAIDTFGSGNFEYHAFIWDDQNGMRDLNDLTAQPTDFILDSAGRINDNGWIVGYGHFGPGWATSRGFVLRPMSAAPLEGDIDGDGDVDLADLAALLAAYATCIGDAGYIPAADLDSSGCVGLNDLALLLANYGAF
jgi:probable HAF family extracellular repeat protein